MAAEVAALQAYMRVASTDGTSLAGHLAALRSTLCQEEDAQSYEHLELISARTHALQVKAEPSGANAGLLRKKASQLERTCVLPGLRGALSFAGQVQDLGAAAVAWRLAGLAAAPALIARMQRGLKAVSDKCGPASYSSVVGLVQGIAADYLVFRALVNTPLTATNKLNQVESVEDSEKHGWGANNARYFFTLVTDVFAAKVSVDELPPVRPADILALRLTKKAFWGKPGDVMRGMHAGCTEAHGLRAQLARLVHATELAVADQLQLRPDAPEPEEEGGAAAEAPPVESHGVPPHAAPAEDFAMPAVGDLIDQEKFVHAQPRLLKTGQTVYPAAPEDDEAAAERLNAVVEADPVEDPLRPISADLPELGDAEEHVQAAHRGGSAAWRVRQVGDRAAYEQGEDDGDVDRKLTRAAHAESLTWRGAHAVVTADGIFNIYLGDGVKTTQNWLPELVAVEDQVGDVDEQAEPFPLEEDAKSDNGEEDAE